MSTPSCFWYNLCMAGKERLSSEGQHYRSKNPTALTMHETEILELLAQGHTRKETAEILGVCHIESSLTKLLDKLGAFSTAQAVFAAAEQRLINLQNVIGGFDLTVVRKLTPEDHQILETMTRNGGEYCGYDDLARETRLPNAKGRLGEIAGQLGIDGRIQTIQVKTGIVYLAAKEAGILNI